MAFDHLAFRTLGVAHLGIASLSSWFTDLGYTERDELRFPAKRLRARWFSPPSPDLPRVFISELLLEELPPRAQEIVSKYTREGAAAMGKYGPAAAMLGLTPWAPPSLEDYVELAALSEYGSWVLANGFSVNHVAVSVHRLAGLEGGLAELNDFLKQHKFELNVGGGEVKVSPDGLLLQSSTVADRREYTFAGGECAPVTSGYIEFAAFYMSLRAHLRGGCKCKLKLKPALGAAPAM